jgi:hypothetical protein
MIAFCLGAQVLKPLAKCRLGQAALRRAGADPAANCLSSASSGKSANT